MKENIFTLCRVLKEYYQKEETKEIYLAEQSENGFNADYRAFSKRPQISRGCHAKRSPDGGMVEFGGVYPAGLGRHLLDEVRDNSYQIIKEERYGDTLLLCMEKPDKKGE
tara:strand:+ start:2126 stop:2455 length:330 start_codon:yes stop_codon:yes gene_type:complete